MAVDGMPTRAWAWRPAKCVGWCRFFRGGRDARDTLRHPQAAPGGATRKKGVQPLKFLNILRFCLVYAFLVMPVRRPPGRFCRFARSCCRYEGTSGCRPGRRRIRRNRYYIFDREYLRPGSGLCRRDGKPQRLR